MWLFFLSLLLWLLTGCDGVHYSIEGFMESMNYPMMPDWPIICNRTLLLPSQYRVVIEFQTFELCEEAILTVSYFYITVRGQRLFMHWGGGAPQMRQNIEHTDIEGGWGADV